MHENNFPLAFHGITYNSDNDSVITAHLPSGTKIGEVEIENGWLKHINVDEDHRRKGIGKKLIELAIADLWLEKIPCVTECQHYRYCLTARGEKLIVSCVRKNIIKRQMCVFGGEDPHLLEERANADPFYNSYLVLQAFNEARVCRFTQRLITDYFKAHGEDISSMEMTDSAFGKGSNTSKKLKN